MQKYSDTHSNYAPPPRQQLRDVGEGLPLAGGNIYVSLNEASLGLF